MLQDFLHIVIHHMEKKFYTLQEVTGLLGGIAPKTLREWMQRLGMQAVQDKRDPRRWLLSWQQIEHLAAAHGRIVGAENAPTTDPLAALEARLMAEIRRLEREIKRLEQRLQDTEQPTIKIPAVRAPEAQQPASPAQPVAHQHVQPAESRPSAAEGGTLSHVGARIFLKSHGVSEAISRKWYDLRLESRRAVLMFALQRAPLRRCEDVHCVCRDLLPDG